MAAIPLASQPPDAMETQPADSTSVSNERLKALIVDDTYLSMRDHFLRPSGRGRPKTLPSSIPLTHRPLVQLYYLKEEDDQCTFTVLQEWLCKLIPTLTSVTKSRITHHVTSTYKSCQHMTEQSVVSFLDEEFDFFALPPSLSYLGLNRLKLLDIDTFIPLSNISMENQTGVTNDVVRALEHFQVQENLPLSFVIRWIKKLDSTCYMNVCRPTDSQLRSKILSVCKIIRAFVKSKKTKELKEFLSQPFLDFNLASPNSPSPSCDDLGATKENKKLRKTNEILQTKICQKGVEIAVLREECNDLRQKSEGHDHLEGLVKEKIKENKTLISQLKEKESQVNKMTQSRTYALNASLRKEIKGAVEKIDDVNRENEDLKEEITKVKRSLKVAQTGKRKYVKKFEKEKERYHSLTEEYQSSIDEGVDTSLKCENSNLL